MSRNTKCDIDQLKNYKINFDREKNSYMNSTYNTFLSGYISQCSDPYVSRIRQDLSYRYQFISEAYTKINTWWSNYDNDIEKLEISLTYNKANGNGILDGSTKSVVNSLPELTTYNLANDNYYFSHYSAKAVPIQNININVKLNNSTESELEYIYSNDVLGSYSNGIIDILLGDDKVKKPGIFSVFEKHNQELVDKYGLDKYGINYYDIKKVYDLGNAAFIDLDNGCTLKLFFDDNGEVNLVGFTDKNGNVISDFKDYGIPAGSIKSIDNSNSTIITFTMNNGSKITFDTASKKILGLTDSKGNYYSYYDYKLDNYGVIPQDIASISKDSFFTTITLKNGGTILINNDNYQIISVTNANGVNVLELYNKYNLVQYGAKVCDIVSITSINEFNCIQLANGTKLSFDQQTGELFAITIGKNGYYFSDGHITSATLSPSIFRRNNLENNQYGGNQMVFSNNFEDVLNNPDIMKILRENFPDATMEDYELYLKKLSSCGCGYTAEVNSIFEIYEGREEEFYNKFGLSMYTIDVDGNVDYNYEPLIVGFFTYIWKEKKNMSIEEIYGDIKEKSGNDASLTGENSTGATGAGVDIQKDFSKYLYDKFDIKFHLDFENSDKNIFENNFTIEDYNRIMSEHPNSEIFLSTDGYSLYYINDDGTRGNPYTEDGRKHAMIIVGVENNELIVSSWGNKYIIDVSNLDNEDDWLWYTIVEEEKTPFSI
ncbi:MAG: hypothetical protein IKN87_00220 [Bacilli bacterium]|nr:hypothetical protein [Bacilli bacterium]